ncbi:MAG: hypothetical protein ABIF87_00040 [Pseudomonadota bacterium]
MSKIFLPLRSNAAWFVEEQARSELERRIKIYMVLYDEIIFQDGRYVSRAGETGSFDILMPSDRYPGDRTSISFCKPGHNFSVVIAGQKIIGGKAQVAYETDFYPIIHDSGLFGMDYFKWNSIDISNEDKQVAQKIATTDLNNEEIVKSIQRQYFIRKNVLESLFIDSILSFRLRLPFLTDFRMLSIIKQKNNEFKLHFEPSIEGLFFDNWISMELPDFSYMSWEKVHEIRESEAGQNFRLMIAKLSTSVQEKLSEIDDERDIEKIVNWEFFKETIDEFRHFSPTYSEFGLNIGLNLIPYGAFIGTMKDFSNLLEYHNSWVTLLSLK